MIGPEVFIVQPGFVQGLVEHLGFDDQSAGYAASIEVWGITATTVLMTFFAHHFNWRKVITISLILVALSNLACIGVHDKTLFVLCASLRGWAAGSLISLSFTTVGLTEQPGPQLRLPHHVGAAVRSGRAVRDAGGLRRQRHDGPAVVLCRVSAGGAAVGARRFPQSGETVAAVEADAVNLSAVLKGAALAAMFAYFIAQGVAWAYLFLIGTAGGLSEQKVANALTLSQFAGVAGALLPAMLGSRFGRWRPLSIGIVGGAVALVFLIGHFEYLPVHDLGLCVQLLLEHDPPVPARLHGELRSARTGRRVCGGAPDAGTRHRACPGRQRHFAGPL